MCADSDRGVRARPSVAKAARAGVGGGIVGHMGDSGGAARLSLVRSAEAGYDRPDVLSEEGGRLTRRGREQALIVATRLRDQEVHAVYGSPMTRAQETAEILGSVLAVPVTTLPGLEEPWVGDLDGAGFERGRAVYQRWLAGDLGVRWPGAETGQEVIARMTHALEYVAAATADGQRSSSAMGASCRSPCRGSPGTAGCRCTRRRPWRTAVLQIEAGEDTWRFTSRWGD